MTDDSATHVILLTPEGRGAVAALCVEGPRALEAVAAHFHPASQRSLAKQPLGRIVFGHWDDVHGEEVVVCRRCHQQVEVHCHGGSVAAAAIAQQLHENGCRSLNWHDWIRRHEPDATRVEARWALAQAPTQRTALILLDQFQGALGRELKKLEARITAKALPQAVAGIRGLLEFETLGRHLVAPWRVVLAGGPNVGKSSLINALLGFRRTIVFDRPGTTRDVVTASMALDGWPVELADTAGLRADGDDLETAGMERARDSVQRADLLVLVFDATSHDDRHFAECWPDALRVESKCDLMPQRTRAGLGTSTITGEGIEALSQSIVQRLIPKVPSRGTAVPFTDRQRETLADTESALEQGDLQTAATQLAKVWALP